MTAWQVIEQLYDSEINAGLQSDWDGGITVWIGGPADTPGNGCLSSRTFTRSEFADVALWLDGEARHLFPGSEYAQTQRFTEDLSSSEVVRANSQSQPGPRHRSVFAQRE
jgi:hypothetical protein